MNRYLNFKKNYNKDILIHLKESLAFIFADTTQKGGWNTIQSGKSQTIFLKR